VTTFSGITGIARLWVLLCWFAWLLLFLSIKKPPKEAAVRRALSARAGIVLQAVSFFPAWWLRTEMYPHSSLPVPLVWLSCLLSMLLAAGGVWMVVAARRALGKQWSYDARLVEGHRLVVEGPYAYVRHPIYSAMLGMLLATALAFSVWWVTPLVVGIYATGTLIRVRAEERLLHEAFGEDFDAYRHHVPAVIPRWRSH
jgi:protein-S-isoprenylcysteine O-methyltransferase Ste14